VTAGSLGGFEKVLWQIDPGALPRVFVSQIKGLGVTVGGASVRANGCLGNDQQPRAGMGTALAVVARGHGSGSGGTGRGRAEGGVRKGGDDVDTFLSKDPQSVDV